MQSFLSEVAQDLYGRYGGGVGELKMLFPSRRARLFFTDALAAVADRPIWEPEWVAIDEVMSRVAQVEVGERVRLVAELFKIYKRHHPSESFDRFYSWGEVLLSDFDMVDKYMIDADMLFRNVADIKELESDLSYLSENERRIVAFWSSIGAEEDLSEHKRRFLKVWKSLAPIYHSFRERLKELGFAYSGMVHRIAAERLRSGEYSIEGADDYVVVGFNALSECEKVLFDELKRGGRCSFYWDRDDYYLESSKQEAGLFLSENIKRFPSAAHISHDNFAREKQMSVVATSSAALQCKYVTKILDQIVASGGVIDKRTAIVLTDESLLSPLLYALPKYVGKVNVTMGYPLRQSLAYSFVERLLGLQHHSRRSSRTGEVTLYHVDVMGLIAHPYLELGVDSKVLNCLERQIRAERMISVPVELFANSDNELLKLIFRKVDGWVEVSKYITEVVDAVAALPQDEQGERVEFLGFISDQITMLHNSIESCSIDDLSTSTYVSLLRRHLQPLRVPFEGEPLEGLQVMGILETRTLDFDNVIILSMNDDNFPGSRVQQPSYIPYNLRAAYELPTPEHHDGVYAYYFYRLIQRCERLWMLYCSCADDKSTGEQSRYITQLDYESPFSLSRVDVGVDVNLFESEVIEVEKRGRVAEQLARFCGDMGGEAEVVKLSPTALFQYVACPLRFYFRSLARISVRDELSEQVDAPMFGTILHSAMQHLYDPLKGVPNVAESISKIKGRDVDEAVSRAILESYLKIDREKIGEASNHDFSGNLLIVREVISKYIRNGILKYDGSSDSPKFEIVGNEEVVEHFVKLENGADVRLWGICDRIDRLSNGALRVVDYKSGAEHLTFDGLDALFFGEGKQRQSNIFQTLLYSYMLRQEGGGGQHITPSLYYVRSMNQPDYSPLLMAIEGEGRDKVRTPIEDYEPYHKQFEELLRVTLEELFNPEVPFRQCEDKATCEYCDYNELCQ
ncbi:MAG: PD-(D/E)XK nuclease family protein [Rikenellaceae bacterium]